jgi:hypothetical protein
LRQFDQDLTGAKTELGKQQERAASAEQAAAEAKKATEAERLARVELEKLVSWRSISLEKRNEIGLRLKKFKGIRIAFTVNAGDPEGFAFATQIADVALQADWQIVAFAPVTNLGGFQTGVRVTTTGDKTSMDASLALVGELKALHFAAERSPEIDTRPTDPLKRQLVYVFVELRPQAVPNEVSKTIATQK